MGEIASTDVSFVSFVSFVPLNREHGQQPDYDSSSHLWGCPDVPRRPRVSLHLLFSRTGRLVRWNHTIHLFTYHAYYPTWSYFCLCCQSCFLTMKCCCLCISQLLVWVPGASTWRWSMRCRWDTVLNKNCTMSAKCETVIVAVGNICNGFTRSNIFCLRQCEVMWKQCNPRVTLMCVCLICSYWTSCQWFIVHASSSTVCK